MKHIAGDAIEHSRIRLERDLNDNIPSPPSMSPVPEDDDVSSVDFPRHLSNYPSFQTFEHASHLDSDFYSLHGGEDSIVLDPELGYTMSTAAHHASALTLSAGLRGRSAYNHTSGKASLSGAEFDPDRPLQAILDNRIADGLSLFDATPGPKSQNQTRTVPSYNPVIVDSTAELDRFLRTGHNRTTRLAYPMPSRSHSQPSSDASDSDAPHPRLSQALGGDFSPKRPRSAPVPATKLSARSSKSQIGSIHPTPLTLAPEVEKATITLQPARDKTNEVGPKDADVIPRLPRTDVSYTASRTPFCELGNKKTRVHLPDVTGLTSAVQSPIKHEVFYANVEAPTTRRLDLLPALEALQMRLQALERANSVSRRRVRELEHELEGCRAEVLAERTRIEEHERKISHAKEKHHRIAVESRYRTVVAEKKALEALIATLQSHLARLTAELSKHKTLVESLRTRADYDARAEIQSLRSEVERLAGEVERLKAIVEEGLRERRRARQSPNDDKDSVGAADNINPMSQEVGIDLTYVTGPRSEAAPSKDEPLMVDDLQSGPEQGEPQQDDVHERYYTQKNDSVHSQNYPQRPEHHRREPGHDPGPDPQQIDDQYGEAQREQEPPTLEPQIDLNPTQRYINTSEIMRIEAEMTERRSERSRSSIPQRSRDNDSGNGSSLHDDEPAPSVRLPRGHRRKQRTSDTDGGKENKDPSATSVPRPSVCPPRTPFPQIRGPRMERLFFSAHEHNVRTCAVCRRRKRQAVPLYDVRTGRDGDSDTDEEIVRAYLRKRAQRSKGPVMRSSDDSDDARLPPQTVLTRVLRDLEDDFSHYKAIYLELAEQYGLMDAASNVSKRNVLAEHLRDVIDTLEQKGDQIVSLYDLLSFQDKPLRHMSQTHQKRTAYT